MRHTSSLSGNLLFFAFLGLLAWAPVPLASNRTWALGLLAGGMLLLLAVAVVRTTLRGHSVLERFGAGRWPLVCMLLYAAWIAAQWVGFGGFFVTADRFNTLQYLLATLTYSAAFALVLLLVRGEQRMIWLMAAVVVIGVLEGLVAIALFASHAEHIYLFMPYKQGARAMGTFANFDHLAAFMEMCVSIGIGLMLARMNYDEPGASSARQKAVALLKFVLSRKMLVRLMLVMMVITLVLTRSRMGNVAFFTSLLLVGGLGMLSNPRLRRNAMWLVVSLVVVDVVIVGQWVGLDRVVERLQNTAVTTEEARGEETLEQRADTPRQALGMVRERPLTGFGAGAFYTVFPRFKSADKENYWNHAHSDYVQIAAETGLVGLALLAAVVLMTIGRIVRFWNERESRLNRGVAFGVAMAVSCMLIHGWVDFIFQIPANALFFSVLLALVWALVPRSRMLKG